MCSTRNGYWVVTLQIWFYICSAKTTDTLIRTADIYYQRIYTGQPRELRLALLEQLNSTNDLKVIVHGFLASRTHISIVPLRNAYMARATENVLLADWQDAASLDYLSSRAAVARVALHFAQLLQQFMHKHNIDPMKVHIIGHSLGAHIAGCIGDYFGGKLGRITGLDPALPLFAPHSSDSLHANAGKFVDVIHTDFPVFGDITPRGSVDFYPNFGHTPQPGCAGVDLVAANSCSHNLAVLLYAESIGLPDNFPAVRCTLAAIRTRQARACTQSLSVSVAMLARDATVAGYMGEHVSHSRGFFYLQTHETPPYGFGVYSLF